MSLPPLVVATRNPGKRREITVLLAGAGVDLRDLRAYPSAPLVLEDHDSYLANAAAKAMALARWTNAPALADDSGLEVDALDGQPGVRSARFAGPFASDAENVDLLLQQLRDVEAPRRGARFRCVLVAARPDGTGVFAEGVCEGTIALAPCGDGGFGYDPVFYCPALQKTLAQLDAEAKNRISHRAQACARLRPLLAAFLRP
jgi:XTP/dITP diphosphohydrolase